MTTSMTLRMLVLTAVLAGTTGSSALAQTDAAIGLGLSISTYDPSGPLSLSANEIGPVLRLRSGTGLGPSLGFSWYKMAVETPVGGQVLPVGGLHVRPVMAGVGYTLMREPWAISFSIVGGYAFMSLDANDRTRAAYRDAMKAAYTTVKVSGSLAWRPQVSLWYDVAPRVGLVAGIGYVGVHPTLRLITDLGEEHRALHVDSMVLTLGFVYGVF